MGDEKRKELEKQSMALQQDYETLIGTPLKSEESQKDRDELLNAILDKAQEIKEKLKTDLSYKFRNQAR